MGGWGSGSSRGRKDNTSDKLCLDLYRLLKNGGLFANGEITWSVNGEKTSSIGYNYYSESSTLQFNYSCEGKGFQDSISIVKIITNFKSSRKAFCCPSCRRRVIKLYLKNFYFRCRHCHNLAITSSQEGYIDRLIRKNHKLKDKLDGEFGYLRPKYMRWKTYNKIASQIEQCDNEFAYQMNCRYGFIV